jgi:hypothetical protein
MNYNSFSGIKFKEWIIFRMLIKIQPGKSSPDVHLIPKEIK